MPAQRGGPQSPEGNHRRKVGGGWHSQYQNLSRLDPKGRRLHLVTLFWGWDGESNFMAVPNGTWLVTMGVVSGEHIGVGRGAGEGGRVKACKGGGARVEGGEVVTA